LPSSRLLKKKDVLRPWGEQRRCGTTPRAPFGGPRVLDTQNKKGVRESRTPLPSAADPSSGPPDFLRQDYSTACQAGSAAAGVSASSRSRRGNRTARSCPASSAAA